MVCINMQDHNAKNTNIFPQTCLFNIFLKKKKITLPKFNIYTCTCMYAIFSALLNEELLSVLPSNYMILYDGYEIWVYQSIFTATL